VLVEGTPLAAAPALAAASDTPRIAFAPRFALFGVPSRSMQRLSMARWSAASMPQTAGPRTSFTFLTAWRHPLPR
jgi:hypothetical protein